MRYLFVFIIVSALIGCGKGDSKKKSAKSTAENSQTSPTTQAVVQPQSPEGVDLVPLTIGNRWVFQITALDTLTGKMRKTKVDTFFVSRDSIIQKETWYHIDGMGPNGTWATNRTDGFWIIGPLRRPMLLAKYPSKPGEEFTKIVGPGTIINRVEATGVKVSLSGGTYSCNKYAQEFGSKKRTSYSYFAPGIGFVKMEIMNETLTHPVLVSKLISAEIK